MRRVVCSFFICAAIVVILSGCKTINHNLENFYKDSTLIDFHYYVNTTHSPFDTIYFPVDSIFVIENNTMWACYQNFKEVDVSSIADSFYFIGSGCVCNTNQELTLKAVLCEGTDSNYTYMADTFIGILGGVLLISYQTGQAFDYVFTENLISTCPANIKPSKSYPFLSEIYRLLYLEAQNQKIIFPKRRNLGEIIMIPICRRKILIMPIENNSHPIN